VMDLVRPLDVVLLPLGFVRKKRVWNRSWPNVIDAIDLQVSKGGDTATLNVGVLDRDVYRLCWDEEPPTLVDVASCTAATRVGELLGDVDTWWNLSDESAVNELVRATEATVVPFLDRLHSRKGMIDHFVAARVVERHYPPPIISLAILKHLSGEETEACTLLSSLGSSTTSAWRQAIERVARHFGC